MVSNIVIFERSKVAVREALQAANKMASGLKMLQTTDMPGDYPPAYLIISDELTAQTVCAISTHRKNDHLVLRVWSPFTETIVNEDGSLGKDQPHYDFEYRNEADFDGNAREIGRLIWHYNKLLWDWHMTYSQDFECFDLDKD